MDTNALWLRTAIALFVVGGSCRAFAVDAPSVQWRTEQIRVVRPDASGRFQVEIGQGAGSKTVPLPYGYASILKLSLVRDRFVIVGDQGYGSIVSVIELSSATALLTTSCGEPTISPDGTFMAFKRFYPRTVPQDVEWPQVEIVDVIAKILKVQALYPAFDAPDRQSADFHARREHVPISPLVWSEDSRYLVYFDKGVLSEQEDRWKDYTVDFMVFEFDKTQRTNATKSAIVDVDAFVDHSFPKPLDRIAFGIQSLRFVNNEIMEATVFPQEYLTVSCFRFDMKKAIASGHLDPLPCAK